MSHSPAARSTGFAGRFPVEIRRLALVPECRSVRAVHFIDIENLCGVADVQVEQARQAMRDYHSSVHINVGDHVIVGASHHNAFAAGMAWRGARLLDPRSGADGADRVLSESIRTESIASRFPVVYIGSGDGWFGEDLAFLAAQGATTHVVSRREGLSASLRIAAHHITMLQTGSIPFIAA